MQCTITTTPFWWPPSTTMVSSESLPHSAGSLRCLQEEMARSRLWLVCLCHKWCLTLSIPTHWQSWLVACPSFTPQMMLLCGWPTAVHRGCTQQQQQHGHVNWGWPAASQHSPIHFFQTDPNICIACNAIPPCLPRTFPVILSNRNGSFH